MHVGVIMKQAIWRWCFRFRHFSPLREWLYLIFTTDHICSNAQSVLLNRFPWQKRVHHTSHTN